MVFCKNTTNNAILFNLSQNTSGIFDSITCIDLRYYVGI